MSVAKRTREAVDKQPFLHAALRAGVVNYTAAARWVDVGDEEAVAAALRRYATEVQLHTPQSDGRVRMIRNVGVDGEGEPVLAIDGNRYYKDGGSSCAILATGTVSPAALATILRRCEIQEIDVTTAGMAQETLVVVVDLVDGSSVLRIAEDVLHSDE